MQRSFRLVLSLSLVILSGWSTLAQERSPYKDVLLDGKPAKLNVVTGEITLVDKIEENNLKQKDTAVIRKPEIKDSITFSIESDYHTVKEKETLLDIANKYNTTLTELKRINNLETTLVDEGQVILVRGDKIELVDDNEITETEEPYTEISEVPSNEIGYPRSSTDFHTVEEGQTLYSLAKLYGLTVNELKRHNGLTSNLIKVGQELRITNFDAQNREENLSVWVVSKGDTLYSIAKKNGLTVDALKRINGLRSNLILVGQKLQLK